MSAPFARVEKQELPESWKVVFDGAPGIPGMDFYEKRVAESIADRFNAAFHARCAPLVEALEKIERSCPDTISRLWAQKALEDFHGK